MSTTIARQISDRMHQIDQQVLRFCAMRMISTCGGPRDRQRRRSRFISGMSLVMPIAIRPCWPSSGGNKSRAEIWESEQIASKWGFDTSKLGGVQTGMGMADTDSANLTFPEKADLIAYAEWSIRLFEEQFGELDDATLSREVSSSDGTSTSVGAAILSHLTHASRHLGMVEALRGVQGERGTASR